MIIVISQSKLLQHAGL